MYYHMRLIVNTVQTASSFNYSLLCFYHNKLDQSGYKIKRTITWHIHVSII
jgi:hypothetical protein